jgi:hypothetical protein
MKFSIYLLSITISLAFKHKKFYFFKIKGQFVFAYYTYRSINVVTNDNISLI